MWRWDRFEWYGQVNLLKGGLAFADAATTVSATHANELRTAGGGFGLHATFLSLRDRFVGIANGIDQSRWNPATDPLIPARFSADDLAGKGECRRAMQEALGLPVRGDVPIFVMTARLVTQKGLSLIVETPGLFDIDAQWVFVGAGERRFEDALRGIARVRPDRVVVDTNFSDGKEHLLMAAGDVCLMPCQYEPCGLTQMRAQRYGTLPLVRRVGGLADTVEDGVTGFAFDQFDAGSFAWAVRRALGTFHDTPTWHRMMLAAMARDFDWGRSEERFRDLYRGVLAAR
jgi:starch synthase